MNTITQEDILAAKLGETAMIGRLAKSGLESYLTAAANAMREKGARPDSHLIQGMLAAWRENLCHSFASQMLGVCGKGDMFAKMEFGGHKVAIALIFGEGELTEALGMAFEDFSNADHDELSDEDEE